MDSSWYKKYNDWWYSKSKKRTPNDPSFSLGATRKVHIIHQAIDLTGTYHVVAI